MASVHKDQAMLMAALSSEVGFTERKEGILQENPRPDSLKVRQQTHRTGFSERPSDLLTLLALEADSEHTSSFKPDVPSFCFPKMLLSRKFFLWSDLFFPSSSLSGETVTSDSF